MIIRCPNDLTKFSIPDDVAAKHAGKTIHVICNKCHTSFWLRDWKLISAAEAYPLKKPVLHIALLGASVEKTQALAEAMLATSPGPQGTNKIRCSRCAATYTAWR